MNRRISTLIAAAILMLQPITDAAVTHWRFVKGAYYKLHAVPLQLKVAQSDSDSKP